MTRVCLILFVSFYALFEYCLNSRHQVSDAILDACLAQDRFSRVACETAAKTGMIMVLGEITTKANIDYQKVIRETIKKIGYDDSAKGIPIYCDISCLFKQQNKQQASTTRLAMSLLPLSSSPLTLLEALFSKEMTLKRLGLEIRYLCCCFLKNIFCALARSSQVHNKGHHVWICH